MRQSVTHSGRANPGSRPAPGDVFPAIHSDASLSPIPQVRIGVIRSSDHPQATDAVPATFDPRPALPLVAVARTADGLLATSIPSVPSGVIDNAQVSNEYRKLALDTARQTLIYLGQEEMSVVVAFVRDPNRTPSAGPRIAYEGFVAREHPDVVFICADETPMDRLPRVVAHEVAHLVYNASHPHDGHAPWDDSPSERLANELSDRLFGPDPEAARRATQAREYAQFVSLPGRASLPSGQAEIGHGSITVTNPGGTVIIDGTSDMFRIAATGTMIQAFPVATGTTNTNTVTLTSLGTFSLPPVMQGSVTRDDSSAASPRTFSHSIAMMGGAAGTVGYWASMTISLNGSSNAAVLLNASNFAASGTGLTAACRYYVLAQTSI